MAKTRILITGATGMLGACMVNVLGKYFNVFATGNSDMDFPEDVPYKKFDLRSDDYTKLIEWSNPNIVIHCAALTNGNHCETYPLEAFEINSVSVKKILEATNSNVKLMYISSDAVFSSDLHMAKEEDLEYPENIYGKSKALGEYFLRNSGRDFLIIRTTIVGLNLNEAKTSFAEWIIKSSIEKERINLFDDVLFTPISIWQLIQEIKFLIENDGITSEVVHITGSEVCTKYEFGKLLLKELCLSTNEIQKASILDFKKRAKRSLDQSLAVDYYIKKHQRKLPTVGQVINSIKEHYIK